MAKTNNIKTSKNVDLSRPFLGLRSFEEQNKSQFGGRDKEINDLFGLVEDNGLTVVFGTSGIGKTSLLKAGLMPKLRQKFYYPIYIRIDYSSKKTPLRQLKDLTYNSIIELDASIPTIDSITMWEYLHDVKLLNGLVTPVLILDQFEEIFTLGKDSKVIKDFITELGDLAQNRIPKTIKEKYKKQGKTVPSHYSKQSYHVILSLREDYLARLDELKNHIPSIMDNGFRVVQMTVFQALEAAIKPGKGLIDETVAKEIIKKLPGVSQDDFDLLKEKGEEDKNLKVEPFLLSLICDRLNEKRIEMGLNTINKKIVDEFQMDDVIESFYNETLKKFKPNITLAIEDRLLDRDGYRKLYASKEFQSEYNISNDEIDELVDSRIIRRESRNNIEYLELIHDVLAPIIKKKRDRRIKDELKVALVKENEAKEKKRFRRVLLVFAIIIISFGSYYVYSRYNLNEKEDNIWKFALQTETADGYKSYLENFPYGKKIDSAKLLIDEYYWNLALKDTTENGYKTYLEKSIELDTIYDYKAKKVNDANDNINKIIDRNGLEERLDKEAWEKADSLKTFDGYLEYIMGKYKNKHNINQAIFELKKKNLGVIGLLYCGDTTNGYTVTNPVFKYVWRKNHKSLTSNDVPSVGDVISPLRGRYTYKLGFLSNSRNNSATVNEKTWQINENAYVLGAIINYDDLFLQIVYKK